VINEARFDNALYYFRYDREVGDWAIVGEYRLLFNSYQ